MSRTLRIILVVTVVVIAAGATLVVVDPFGAGHSTSGATNNSIATATVAVERRTLSSQTNVVATLGYAGSYDVVNQEHGTITWLPAVGQVVQRGQVLYDVDGAPVMLMYGTTPSYRPLAEGTASSPTAGADVQQLNANLVALGFATGSRLDPSSNEFTAATKTAVEKLQRFLGVTADGTLALGPVVFLPTAARITARGRGTALGSSAQPGATILQATSTSRVVTIDLDAAHQDQVKPGDAVTITLPDTRTTPGRVWSVGTVATAPASSSPGQTTSPTIEVDVVPSDPAATGRIDQAPVTVAITNRTARDALVVPVNALLALAGSGYAVEQVAADDTHHMVAVTVGLFDDAQGLVQIEGGGVHVGMNVVVPST